MAGEIELATVRTLTHVLGHDSGGLYGRAVAPGAVVSSTVLVGAAVPLTTIVAANVTSISLVAGEWLVFGNVGFNQVGTTSTTLGGWISTTTAALPTAPNSGAEFFLVMTFPVSAAVIFPVGSVRLSLGSTTTVYLSAYAQFTGGTSNSAYGYLGATRIS